MTAVAAFVSVRTEGGLLPSDLLARVAALDPTLDDLTPAGYHLLPGERLGEAITRSWNRLVGAWAAFQGATEGSRERTGRRWLVALFAELGYGQLQAAKPVEVDDRQYPVSHGWGHVPIHLVAATAGLDVRTPGVAGAARMSPHALVQELLNRSDEHLWAFVSNGLRLRVLRDNAALTRQAFVEFDLDAMFAGQVYADFAVLWLVCHESRVEGDPPEKCVLERWSADAAKQGARALDQLRTGVESAINKAGAGFLAHPANQALKEALRSGALDRQDYYRQLLRLVYRLLFVLVAEARDLLLDPTADPTAKQRYRTWYSLHRLRDLADVSRGGPHADLWRQLRIVFAALGSPSGQPALGLPGLGSYLWSDRATPDLDHAELSNRALLAAIHALTSIRDDKERVRRSVDYRNLGSEELGSVYESLLELHPNLDEATGAFSLTTAGGNERKTTGSYYTPSSLIAELLDSALEPVIGEAAQSTDPEAAILDLTVLDPACGSGHFLIAAARRLARRLAAVRSDEDESSPTEVRRAFRDVVGRCIHGIDMNEMAVELCKVSLWMEAMEPGKPLTFLEDKIVHGNSLLGATPRLLAGGVPDEAFKPLDGDDKSVAAALRKTNKVQRDAARAGHATLDLAVSVAALQAPLTRALAEIDAMPSDTVDQLAAKEHQFSEYERAVTTEQARMAADAWCSAFVAPKTKESPKITESAVLRFAAGKAVEPEVVEAVQTLKDQYRFLHPHLAFPGVFHVPEELDPAGDGPGWEGGFDIVLGNPPWEKIKLSEKEFFAVRAPEIAELAGSKRKAAIAAVRADDPELWKDFQVALRQADGESHLLRQSGRYPLCGRGDVNTYAVFAEVMRAAVSDTGRMGVIVPTGIATDDTTKAFFADCVDRHLLASLYDFENRAALFPDVDSRMKFCLLTLTGAGSPVIEAAFSFFAHHTTDLADPDRRFTLTPADLALLNPNTRTTPLFRTRRDAELTKAIYRRVPVLVRDGDPNGNPWDIEFSAMFHMTNDSHLFRSTLELVPEGAVLGGNVWRRADQRWLPLYEAKMCGIFDHRAAGVVISPTALIRQGQPEMLSDAEKADPMRVPQPRNWVAEDDVNAHLRDRTGPWLLGFRNVTSATNERTMVPTVLPVSAVGHSEPLLCTSHPHRCLLAAVLSSFAADYIVRQKVGGNNFTFFIVKQIPVLPPITLSGRCDWTPGTLADWLRPRVLELTFTAWDLAAFGNELGWDGPPFRWDVERRKLLRAELDAAFFHLYALRRDDVDYVMDTFPIVRRAEEGSCGEYRSKRLIMERYDAMAEAIASGTPYRTVLHPAPAHPSLAHGMSTRPGWAYWPGH